MTNSVIYEKFPAMLARALYLSEHSFSPMDNKLALHLCWAVFCKMRAIKTFATEPLLSTFPHMRTDIAVWLKTSRFPSSCCNRC